MQRALEYSDACISYAAFVETILLPFPSDPPQSDVDRLKMVKALKAQRSALTSIFTMPGQPGERYREVKELSGFSH